jgi:diacylglycerol kinase family enzyme
VISVLLNPAAGAQHSDNMSSRLTELFGAAGLPVRITPLGPGAEVADLVGLALKEGNDAVLAAGGDGTVSAVAAALAGSEIPLGVLPLGTLNHFARTRARPISRAP